MPRKVRQIMAELTRAGFTQESKRGKGSHTKWRHPLVTKPVVVSGHDGDDALAYQERDAREALRLLREAKENQRT